MKKLFAALAVLVGASASAQDIKIYLEGETDDISGTTHAVLCSGEVTDVYLDVENNSGDTNEYDIHRLRIATLPGITDEICWSGPGGENGTCDEAIGDDFVLDHYVELDPLEKGILKATHKAHGNYGFVHYRYYVVNAQGGIEDSIDVTFESFAGLEETAIEMSLYPNPVQSELTVEVELDQDGIFQLIDLNGRIVFETTISGGTQRFDLSAIHSGIYVAQIQSNDELIRRDQLLVE